MKFVPVGGLTVFYGLNGAGKTRSLNAIRDFWSGWWNPRVLALIELPPSGATYAADEDPYGGAELVSNWAVDWAFAANREVQRNPSAVEVDAILDEYVWSLTAGEPEAYPDDPVVGPEVRAPEHRTGLMDEWSKQRLMLVMPQGSEEGPEWVSAPAAMTGHGTPHFNREADLNERLERSDYSHAYTARCYVTVGSTESGQTIMIGGGSEGELNVGAWDPTDSGRHHHLLPLDTALSVPEPDIDSATRAFLVRAVEEDAPGDSRHSEFEVVDGEVLPSLLADLIGDVQDLANARYGSVLLHAPTLVLDVQMAGLEVGIQWRVQDDRPPLLGKAFDPRCRRAEYCPTSLGGVGHC